MLPQKRKASKPVPARVSGWTKHQRELFSPSAKSAKTPKAPCDMERRHKPVIGPGKCAKLLGNTKAKAKAQLIKAVQLKKQDKGEVEDGQT